MEYSIIRNRGGQGLMASCFLGGTNSEERDKTEYTCWNIKVGSCNLCTLEVYLVQHRWLIIIEPLIRTFRNLLFSSDSVAQLYSRYSIELYTSIHMKYEKTYAEKAQLAFYLLSDSCCTYCPGLRSITVKTWQWFSQNNISEIKVAVMEWMCLSFSRVRAWRRIIRTTDSKMPSSPGKWTSELHAQEN